MLCEKRPNAVFLVRIFPYSDQNKLRIWTFFTQMVISSNKHSWRLFSFETLRCGTYWKVALEKGKQLFQRKKNYKSFVIFSFQITASNYHYII